MVRRHLWATILGLLGIGEARSQSNKSAIGAAKEDQPATVFNVATASGPLKAIGIELVTSTGTEALGRWSALKDGRRGVPIMIGGDEELERILEAGLPNLDEIAATIARADTLGQEFDILAYRRKEAQRLRERLDAEGKVEGTDEFQPEVGEWPNQPEVIAGPTVANDILSETPLPRVHLLLVPTKTNAEIPAWLGWGNWNANPSAEVHIAMLRKWGKSYGAELVGASSDTMNLRVSRRPKTRTEAMTLAREMYGYCPDLVDQGTQEFAPLAALLMASDYWYFWWD